MTKTTAPARPIILLTGDDDLPIVQVGAHTNSSIREWLKKPDKLVTRGEFWEILTRYENGRRRLQRAHSLWSRLVVAAFLAGRALWRWLNVPLFEAPPKP